MPVLHLEGGSIHYSWAGEPGAPVVVLINGVLMDTSSWALQLPALVGRYRVLTYDMRGQGSSTPLRGPYPVEAHVRDLLHLLDGLEIGRAHLAATSFGTAVALVFAAEYPERAASLFLSSPAVRAGPRTRALASSWLYACSLGPGELFRVSLPDIFSGRWIQENQQLLPVLEQRYGLLDLVSVTWLLRALLDLDTGPLLSRIASPCLVVVGGEDTLNPPAEALEVASSIRGAEAVVVPGAGHACHVERPQLWNLLLLGHLARTD